MKGMNRCFSKKDTESGYWTMVAQSLGIDAGSLSFANLVKPGLASLLVFHRHCDLPGLG